MMLHSICPESSEFLITCHCGHELLGRAWAKNYCDWFLLFLCGRKVFKLEGGVHLTFVYLRVKRCPPDYSIFNPIFIWKSLWVSGRRMLELERGVRPTFDYSGNKGMYTRLFLFHPILTKKFKMSLLLYFVWKTNSRTRTRCMPRAQLFEDKIV